MNVKVFGRILITLLLAAGLVSSNLFSVTVAHATTTLAEVGGFLLPWEGDINLSQGAHEGSAIDAPGSFDILAPKDGTIVDFKDDMYSLFTNGCSAQHAGLNYLILGHGPNENGKYDHYSVYYHLSRHSVRNLGLGFDSRVKTGQVIGHTGNTGYVEPIGEHGTGTHLHFYVSRSMPVIGNSELIHCRDKENPPQARTYTEVRGVPQSANSITYGFEENMNNWPPPINLPASRNRLGGLLGSNLCDINSPSATVFLYNHIDYGGECLSVVAPGNGYNVPQVAYGISSAYLNPIWLLISPQYFHTLTLWDGYNGSGNRKVIGKSIPRLNSIGWNDRIKYVHNAVHSNTLWLLEESYAFEAPFDVNVHIRVSVDQDLVAWRVCFDGQNCQENATPIGELFYSWNTYGVADGNHTISIQYRRTSDNGNWANADYHEVSYYLSPNRQTYAPCGINTNGARLVSGSDCIIVTNSVADMAPVAWADRSNLSITAQGFDVLAYDSSDYQGAPRLIRSGQTVSVGGNVSGIELRQPLPASYVPTSPLGSDSNTIVYLPMNEGSGTQVHSQVGSLTGNLVGSYSFTSGRFDSAVSFDNPPDGSGINFGSQNFGSPWTIEMFVKMDIADWDTRLATQLGGGPNTGNLKWLIGSSGGRFRAFTCYLNGCHEMHGLEDVQTDRWYYLMLTYDGNTTAKLYVDNVLQQTVTMDGTMPGGNTTFEIAKGEGISSCNCTIDDFRISNIVREPLGPPANPPTPLPTSTAVPTVAPIATFTPTAVPWNGGLLSNGSFELLTSGWADNWTRNNTNTVLIDTASNGTHGSNSLRFLSDTANHHAFSEEMSVSSTNSYIWLSRVISTSGTGEFGFYIDEYDSEHNWISGQWFSALPASVEGTKIIRYTPSSSSVTYASLQYYMNANTSYQVYVDSVSFTQASSNLVTNGGFESLLNGWADGWTRDNTSLVTISTSSQGNEGTNSLHFAPTSGNVHAFGARIPIGSGTYTWSQYVVSTSGTGEFGFYIDEYNSNGDWISGQWKGGVWGASSGLKSFTYTPSSSNVAFAAPQLYVLGGTTFDVYVDSVSFNP